MREGWDITSIGSLARQIIAPVELKADQQYVNLGVRGKAGGTFLREPKLGSEIKATRLFRVRPGQFVYNRLFAGEGSFSLIRPGDAHAVASNEFPVFETDRSRLLPEYLDLYFQQPSVWKEVDRQCTGTTKSRLRWKEVQFTAYRLPLPPLREQRRIVDLVGALDDAITAVGRVIRSLSLTLAKMRDVAPPGEPGTVADLVGSIVNGLTTTSAEQATGTGRQHFVKASAVEPGQFVPSEIKLAPDQVFDPKYLIHQGDILMTRINTPERVGHLARVDVPTVGLLRPDLVWRVELRAGVDPDFFVHTLSGPRGRSLVSRAAPGTSNSMKQISKARLLALPIEIPDLSAQQGFAERCEALRRAIQEATTEANSLTSLRSHLLAALLSGEHAIPESYDELIGGTAHVGDG